MTIQDSADTPAETKDTDETAQAALYGGKGEENPQSHKEEKADSQEVEGNEEKEPEKKTENEFFGSPENYDYTDLKLPEGLVFDSNLTAEFNELAKELDLSQKGANALMSLAVKNATNFNENIKKIVASAELERVAAYKEALNTDREIGGAKLESVLKAADVAYEKLTTDELKEVFKNTGMNCNPEVVKFFYNLSKQIQDDNIITGKFPTGSKKDPADVLYGSN